VHVFFREVDRTGIERIPRGVPLILAATHTNSVVDGVLLLALPVPRLRLLAKSTLFSHPVMGPLLALVGALPVFRREDPGVDPAQNLGTFARCHEALAAGNSVALFPEGTSHNNTHRLPLKTGAARIALGAESHHGSLGVRIVPVIFDYEAKGRFRSRVRIRIGDPIDPSAGDLDSAATRRAAVVALTQRIAAGMEAAATAGTWPASLPDAAPGQRALRHRWVDPVLVIGITLNWFPYRVPGWIAGWLSRTEDEPATYKLLAGILAFPMAWAAEITIASHFGGAVWGLAIAVAAPASGYAALRIMEARWACTSSA
jgi:1-acyl-sn-glycerol-3-phosphate acyltransferase